MGLEEDDLVRRIRRDLADSYDEELELELEDKKRARLNCIRHLLGQFPYVEVPHPVIELPPRVHHDDYIRRPVPADIIVPEIY